MGLDWSRDGDCWHRAKIRRGAADWEGDEEAGGWGKGVAGHAEAMHDGEGGRQQL